jgi:hypothetical protein
MPALSLYLQRIAGRGLRVNSGVFVIAQPGQVPLPNTISTAQLLWSKLFTPIEVPSSSPFAATPSLPIPHQVFGDRKGLATRAANSCLAR